MKQIGIALAGLAVALTLGACTSNDAAMKAPSSAAYENFSNRGEGPAREADAIHATPLLSAAAMPQEESDAATDRAVGGAGATSGSFREDRIASSGESRTAPIVPAFPARQKGQRLHELETLFFEFDSSTLSTRMKEALERNIAWLKKHGGLEIRMIGHADERGTSEYNLGLGMRRANIVREYLIAKGLPHEKMVTISYGEEMPLHRGHDEESWRQNRRVEFSRAEATAAVAR